LPIDSRIRTRLLLESQTREELLELLRHALSAAGNAALMTDELQLAVCEHAGGNPRTMMTLCSEILSLGAARNLNRLDEALFFELARLNPPQRPRPQTRQSRQQIPLLKDGDATPHRAVRR
jgi:hypothetical protein